MPPLAPRARARGRRLVRVGQREAHPDGGPRGGRPLRDDSPAVGRRARGAGLPAVRRCRCRRTRSTDQARSRSCTARSLAADALGSRAQAWPARSMARSSFFMSCTSSRRRAASSNLSSPGRGEHLVRQVGDRRLELLGALGGDALAPQPRCRRPALAGLRACAASLRDSIAVGVGALARQHLGDVGDPLAQRLSGRCRSRGCRRPASRGAGRSRRSPFRIESVTVSAYMCTSPETFRAARPIVWISDVPDAEEALLVGVQDRRRATPREGRGPRAGG